jgi:hypothetical protein
VLSDTPYETVDVERALAAVPDLTNLSPSYLHAMAYDFFTLAGYVRQQTSDPLIIVIGDHQPPAAVSGPGAPWRVPVHVISDKHHVVQRLIDHGFRPGLEPNQPALGPMHGLVPVFLDAFDSVDPDQHDLLRETERKPHTAHSQSE